MPRNRKATRIAPGLAMVVSIGAVLAAGCSPKVAAPASVKRPSAAPSAPRGSALVAADTLRDQGKVLQAVEAYAAAAQSVPSDHRPWLEIGRLLLANNQPEDARDALAEAVSREPGTSECDAWHGMALVRSGDPETGLKTLRSAVEAVPHSSVAQTLLGDACRDLGLLREERTARETAVRLAADDPETWRNLGKTCYAGKDFARLAEVGETLARLRPDDPDGPVWNALGTAVVGDDKAVATALATARENADRHPKRPFSHLAVGRLAKRLHRWDEARDALRKVVEIDPRRTDAYADLAVVETMLGNKAAGSRAAVRHQAALAARRRYEDLLRAARANPAGVAAQLAAAEAALAQGESRIARECVARARRSDPSNPDIDRFLGRLEALR
jgi:tetratricopeptide (TPR) repeat protein